MFTCDKNTVRPLPSCMYMCSVRFGNQEAGMFWKCLCGLGILIMPCNSGTALCGYTNRLSIYIRELLVLYCIKIVSRFSPTLSVCCFVKHLIIHIRSPFFSSTSYTSFPMYKMSFLLIAFVLFPILFWQFSRFLKSTEQIRLHLFSSQLCLSWATVCCQNISLFILR